MHEMIYYYYFEMRILSGVLNSKSLCQKSLYYEKRLPKSNQIIVLGSQILEV